MPGLDGVTIVCDTCGHLIEMGDIAGHVCPDRKPLKMGGRKGTGIPRRGDLIISGISLDSEVVTIQYLDKADVRGRDGGLVVARQITAGRSHYRDEISEVEESLLTLVLDLLEDWVEAPRWSPHDEDDEDERGMGW